MSNWEYNNVRIYVIKNTSSFNQEIARLQPLRSDTIHHVFGWESATVKLDCIVVGSTNAGYLHSFTQSGVSMELNSPWGDLGDYFLKSIDFDVLPTVSQNIDTTQACDTIVYKASMELYKDG